MPAPKSLLLAARWIGGSPVPIWGLLPDERLRRHLGRAGLGDAGPWTGSVPPEQETLLLRGDHVYDDAVVGALIRAPATVLLDACGRPLAAHVQGLQAEAMARALAGEGPMPEGLSRLTPDQLVSAHRPKLRKRQAAFVLPVTADGARAVEARLFAASYKGVTDAVTKYLWPLPARLATRWCVALGISPNMVTLANLALAVLAALLFLGGHLWSGLACAWAMTFLDTVDGKLARVTLTSSRLGDVLDHGLDLVHPPLWWWAWWVGCGAQGSLALVVVLAGYVLLRAQEGLFLWRFGMELHVWRRFDSLFRLITARRNPILVILTVALAAGQPVLGFQLTAAWTALSVLVHGARMVQAVRANGPLRSWLEA
ncbi:MAG: CDP-alcohol phosphatidyltransferase family protein [Magnetospirillum sp.]|nr:CDP-alcohol phosphatidyltransferase family protein [Magnetospirillum sp.]